MILLQGDRHESPLSIDTKKSTRSPSFDITMTFFFFFLLIIQQEIISPEQFSYLYIIFGITQRRRNNFQIEGGGMQIVEVENDASKPA